MTRMIRLSDERVAELEVMSRHGRASRRIALTYELAMAAGQDAANARMRKGGRTKWNRADYNHATATTAKLLRHLPLCGDYDCHATSCRPVSSRQ